MRRQQAVAVGDRTASISFLAPFPPVSRELRVARVHRGVQLAMSAIIIILARQRDLVERFRDAGATAPGSARPLRDMGVRVSFLFRRLASRGVFVRGDDDRWWFDSSAWNRHRDAQGKRFVVAAVVITVVCLLVLIALAVR